MNIDVSCICLTHGRPWLLAEAVESFRRQRLDGLTAELLIINDCAEQTLACDVPGVVVENLPEQVTDNSIKTNRALMLARGRLACFWDDDDISLPGRIADGVARIGNALGYRAARYWSWSRGVITSIGVPLLCNGMFDREWVLRCGGATAGEWNDKSIWGHLWPTGNVVQYEPRLEEIAYIYRWAGVGYHDSGTNDGNPERRSVAFHAAAVSDPRFKAGAVQVIPGWQMDYTKQARDAAQRKVGA